MAPMTCQAPHQATKSLAVNWRHTGACAGASGLAPHHPKKHPEKPSSGAPGCHKAPPGRQLDLLLALPVAGAHLVDLRLLLPALPVPGGPSCEGLRPTAHRGGGPSGHPGQTRRRTPHGAVVTAQQSSGGGLLVFDEQCGGRCTAKNGCLETFNVPDQIWQNRVRCGCFRARFWHVDFLRHLCWSQTKKGGSGWTGRIVCGCGDCVSQNQSTPPNGGSY